MIPDERRDVASSIRKYVAANPSATDVEVANFLEREGTKASPALIQEVRRELAEQDR